MTNYLKKFKLRTQLLIIISIQIIITCSYVLALNLVHHSLLLQYTSKISNSIFEVNSYHIINNTIKAYSSYFDSIFFLSKQITYLDGNTLISFHRLYHQSKKQLKEESLEINSHYQMNYGGTVKIPNSIRIEKGYGNFDISYSFMCYSNVSDYNSPLTLDEQIGIKLQEQLQAFGQIIYQGGLINQSFLYSYIISEKINAIYPCLNRDKGIYNYIPENRDWYIELKRNFNQFKHYNEYNYSFTTPYLLYTDKKIGLSLGLPIVDIDLNFVGGVASNFLGAQLVTSIKQNNFGFTIIYLISYTGIMIMHPYNVTILQLPLYIFNQSITGFNETDWIEINAKTPRSSCQSNWNFQLDLLCRYNSIYQKEMIIKVEDIPEYKMKLIILLTSEEYINFFSQYQSQLEANLENITKFNLFNLIGVFILFCILIISLVRLIFHPIDVIKSLTIGAITSKTTTKTSSMLNLPLIIKQLMSEDIIQLYQSYKIVLNKLELLSLHKSNQCKFFENIQYPKQYYQLHNFLFKYTEKLFNKIQYNNDLQKLENLIQVSLGQVFKFQNVSYLFFSFETKAQLT